MTHPMTTTTFTLDGYRIARTLGVVRGITVRSRSIFGTIGGSLQTLVGGNISLFTELCEKTRNEAFEMMLAHAKDVGANAVVGVRYDATELMQGVTEVLCYGTAVVVGGRARLAAASAAALSGLLRNGLPSGPRRRREPEEAFSAFTGQEVDHETDNDRRPARRGICRLDPRGSCGGVGTDPELDGSPVLDERGRGGPELPAEDASTGRAAEGRTALALGPTALPFIAVFPCRLVDTRGNAPLTGGFLPPATVRSYTLTGALQHPDDGAGHFPQRRRSSTRRGRASSRSTRRAEPFHPSRRSTISGTTSSSTRQSCP